jgi:uncharacterized protein GlcG (DUF336 family)
LTGGHRLAARHHEQALSIAVVDYGGFVVLVERIDGARPMTSSIALSKAYSAAVMQRPTSMLKGWRNSDPVFFTQVGRMGQHPIVATKGGYTIKLDGSIVGGLGISGGSPDEDQKVSRYRGPPGLRHAAVGRVPGRTRRRRCLDAIAAQRGEADIATSGGFAQVADQLQMSSGEQHAELELAEMVSRYYWGNEI